MKPMMRPGLKWALTFTLLSTGAALIWTRGPVVDASVVRDGSSQDAKTSAPHKVAAVVASGIAPEVVPAATSNSAPAAAGASMDPGFDPFVGVVPPPPPPPPVLAVVQAPPPAPPPPPAQDYRFVGRMTSPDGVRTILVGRGDAVVGIEIGTTLGNGYVVESITPNGVVLVYGNSGVKATLSLPPNDDEDSH